MDLLGRKEPDPQTMDFNSGTDVNTNNPRTGWVGSARVIVVVLGPVGVPNNLV